MSGPKTHEVTKERVKSRKMSFIVFHIIYWGNEGKEDNTTEFTARIIMIRKVTQLWQEIAKAEYHLGDPGIDGREDDKMVLRVDDYGDVRWSQITSDGLTTRFYKHDNEL